MRRVTILLAAAVALACLCALPGAAAAKTVWLCKPGKANDPCVVSLDTTRFSPSGKRLGVDRVKRVRRPKFDCFYVYPTVSDQKTPIANFHIDPEQRSIALRQLVAKEIDPKPKVRKRLISALLLGWNTLVKQGKDTGDFKKIPACRSRTQVGCLIAFSTFNQLPPADAIFGRTTEQGKEVLCTNPAALGGGSAKLTPIQPSAPFAPGTTIAGAVSALGVPEPKVSTAWRSFPGSYRGRCSSAGGADFLSISSLGGAPVFNPSPTPQWGLHLIDANIALGELADVVRAQGAAWLARHG